MEKTTGRRTYRKYNRGQKAVFGEREKCRLLQLGGCILLFLFVFFAKGVDRLGEFRQNLAQILQVNVDFQEAFTNLGWSVASGKPVGKSLNELWVDVFLPQEKEYTPVWQNGPLYQETKEAIKSSKNVILAVKQMHLPEETEQETEVKMADEQEEMPTSEESIDTNLSQREAEVVHVDYNGPALPDNTTMDRYTLGLSETVSPVIAALTSGFGWREHPIEGGEKFHCGVDLGVENGTDISAFAAGTVDYIGESDVYGLYLQLRHDNGVTSFYAHCSKLCVQQGQEVAAGEKVAESGATGEVTGPHLHFEMKKDGIRLNPAYYIETLT